MSSGNFKGPTDHELQIFISNYIGVDLDPALGPLNPWSPKVLGIWDKPGGQLL